ncbi:hypothetical protein EVAR_71974_1 [Eumeta japonica]|uniref:Uncharacterized protein n=1 Tax=Eumeta variegata TaxID=151549 RepID=A0A4C1SZM1_EUMVA|nr:hypothetical protein EVAR_71974_1 [Eumeta japonica]
MALTTMMFAPVARHTTFRLFLTVGRTPPTPGAGYVLTYRNTFVLLSGYRGLGKPRFGNWRPNLQMRKGLWLCYTIALRAWPEGEIGTTGVSSPSVVPK